jgi:single-strand DNA-binding protein
MRQASFAGYVGKDAELTYTATGTAVCKFSIAVNRGKKDGEDLKPIWVGCSIWAKRGESLAPHIKKGVFAVVAGELDIRDYTDKSGASRYSIDLNVQSFTFGSSKNGDAQQEQSAPKTQSAASRPIDDNDIPF